MLFCSRAIAIALLGMCMGVAGCSTLDVRGNTQSSALPGNQRLYGPPVVNDAPADERSTDPGNAYRDRAVEPYYYSPGYNGRNSAMPWAEPSSGDGGAGGRWRAAGGQSGGDQRLDAYDRRAPRPANGGWNTISQSGAQGRVSYYTNSDVAPGQGRRLPAQARNAPPPRDAGRGITQRVVPVAPASTTVGKGSRAGSRAELVTPEQESVSATERVPTAPNYARVGWARWMGQSWLGHKTTTGEMFDPKRLTGAHASLPLPSFLYVTNRGNGRTVLVRINDRVPASDGRVVIVSELAAKLLGFHDAGRAKVEIQYAGAAATVANMKHEQAFLAQQSWFHPDMLRNNLSAQAPAIVTPANPVKKTGVRYPAPNYPRWDGTERIPR